MAVAGVEFCNEIGRLFSEWNDTLSVTAIVYLAIYFSGLIRALTGKPIFGLYSYILTIYMYAPGSWWGESLPDLRWSMLAAVVTLIATLIYSSRASISDSNLDRGIDLPWYAGASVKFFIAFVIWVWLQNIWAIGPERHYEFSILVTKFLILMFLVIKLVQTLRDLCSVIIVHIVGCAFFGYIGLTQFSGGRFESAPTPGMSDGNLLSIHMFPFLVAASYLLLLKLGTKKYFLVPFIVLTLNAIFLTQSRGVLVAIVVVGFLALFWVPKNQKKLFYLFGVFALLGGLSIMGPQLLERVRSSVDNERIETVDQSASSRIYVALAQLEMFREKPIMGHGHKGTLYLSPYFLDEKWLTKSADGTMHRASHNLVLSVLVDHGLLGMTFYFGAIFVIAAYAIRSRKTAVRSEDSTLVLFTGCFLGLVAWIVASQFANSMRLEVGVWFIAMCQLFLRWRQTEKNVDNLQVDVSPELPVAGR